MKKIKLLLLAILASTFFSSCTLDSVSVSTMPTPRYYKVLPANHVYSTRYYYDVRPDWMRYGGNWVPARRRHCHY